MESKLDLKELEGKNYALFVLTPHKGGCAIQRRTNLENLSFSQIYVLIKGMAETLNTLISVADETIHTEVTPKNKGDQK